MIVDGMELLGGGQRRGRTILGSGFVLIFLLVSTCVDSSGINSLAFDSKLRETVDDALGHKELQDVIDKEGVFSISVSNGPNIVEKLASDLGKRISLYNQALTNLRDVAKTQLENPPSSNILECCNLQGKDLDYNSKFNTKVNLQQQCLRLVGNYTRHAGKEFLDTARDNTNLIPNLAWQYLGTEEGLFQTYPARMGMGKCRNYDARTRPYYAEASAPLPKDIVIMFDFNDLDNLNITTDAIEALLNATNDNDRIGMVDIANTDISPRIPQSDCYREQLAYATPSNHPAFKNFFSEMMSIVQKRGTDYRRALQKAFGYFGQDTTAAFRGRLLLLLTDSNPQDSLTLDNINTLVEAENLKLNNTVVIETYAIGAGVSEATKTFLKKLAENTKFITSKEVIKSGNFTQFNSSTTNEFRQTLSSFYNAFADSGSVTEPLITVPYVDFSGLGLVISICLPVLRSNDKFTGVVCIDAKMQDIFLNIAYFSGGKNSYAFLIDKNGRAIIHPLLPRPSKIKDKPIFMDITTLEREPAILEIIQSMKWGQSGSRSLYVSKLNFPFLSTPATPQHEKIMAHYFWHNIPNSNYSLCLVQTNVDAQVMLERIKDGRTDYKDSRILQRDGETCLNDGVVSHKDVSIVDFTEHAYRKYQSGTLSDQFSSYFQQKNPGSSLGDAFKTDVHPWTSLTGFVNEIWSEKSAYNRFIYWRYLVTMSGVMRIYPGTTFSLNPVTEQWYRQALQETENTILTRVNSPRGSSILLSRALRAGRLQTTGDTSLYPNLPVAVLAGEFRPGYFYNLLLELFPDCKQEGVRCFILDYEGYILAHPKTLTSEKMEQLINVEPEIAEFLIKNSMMVGTSCLDFESFLKQENWIIRLNDWIVVSESPKFELRSVIHSNVMIGISWTAEEEKSSFSSRNWVCQQNDGDCECPCGTELKFSYCENKLPDLYREPIANCPVVQETHPVHQDTPEIGSIKDLCFPTSCAAQSFSECMQIINCGWCYPENDKGTSEKECLPVDQCDYVYRSPAGTSDKATNIAVPIILLLIIAAIIIALICLCRMKPEYFKCLSGVQDRLSCLKKKEKPKGDSPEMTGNEIANDSVSTLPRPPVPPPEHSSPPDESLYSIIYDYQSRGLPSRPNTFHSGMPNGPNRSGEWPKKSTLPDSTYLHARPPNSRSASDSEVQLSYNKPSLESLEGSPSYTVMEETPTFERPDPRYQPEPVEQPNPPKIMNNDDRMSVSKPPRIPQFKKNPNPPRGFHPKGTPHKSPPVNYQQEDPFNNNNINNPRRTASGTLPPKPSSPSFYQNKQPELKDYSHYNLGYSDPSLEGYDPTDINRHSYDGSNDRQGFDNDPVYRQDYNNRGYDGEGYDDRQGYNHRGDDRQGYDKRIDDRGVHDNRQLYDSPVGNLPLYDHPRMDISQGFNM